ncbi:MAG: hypothetical protein K0R55_790, partial [Sporomusa sp.]|nr:hypothetical protein [Sporomusa sp.]
MPDICTGMNKLLVYRNLLKDRLVQGLLSLQSAVAEACNEYDIAAELIKWAEENQITGNIPENYLLSLLGFDENIF